ncbi:hypothetical protein LX64_01011 [Chitinophaga skermanii]|uniref:Uncharacterized protein n=1 Tax=Chitinophaga skermanii TaxID=331697 RepID=A0A327QY62_9BACT|nr:hypothetical protein [Chitinophaga skermanii]RAJ08363.1 hypothetical protein LX64_01011 [Chitinophaga skermanii]
MNNIKVEQPQKDDTLVEEASPTNSKVSQEADEIDMLKIYWPAYAYPFMPIMDFSFVFDEIKKIVKRWMIHKKEQAVYKKSTHETI